MYKLIYKNYILIIINNPLKTMHVIIFRKKNVSKKNKNYHKYNKYIYDDIDDKEINILKKAKYISSVFLSDNDELIYHYIKLLNIDHIFPINISINKIMNDLNKYSNDDMIDFIFNLLK